MQDIFCILNLYKKVCSIIDKVNFCSIILLKIIIPRVDLKAESYEKHKRPFDISILAVVIILFAVHWTGILYSLGYNIDVAFIVKFLVGIII